MHHCNAHRQVGMLSLFVFVLVYNRHELSNGVYNSGFAKAVRCLTSGYKNRYYYWEVRHLGFSVTLSH